MNYTLNRRGLLLASAALLAGTAAGAKTAPPAFKGPDLSDADYGHDFKLKDPQGRERSLAEWRGKAVMLHFGFTQCPDACPTTLARAAEVRRLLGPLGKKLQVVFITLDPERDTPELLSAYTAAFDPTIVPLYGDLEHTRAVAQSFHIFFKKVQTGSSYTLDHSTVGFAFDPKGRLRVGLRHTESAEDCAHDLRQLLA